MKPLVIERNSPYRKSEKFLCWSCRESQLDFEAPREQLEMPKEVTEFVINCVWPISGTLAPSSIYKIRWLSPFAGVSSRTRDTLEVVAEQVADGAKGLRNKSQVFGDRWVKAEYSTPYVAHLINSQAFQLRPLLTKLVMSLVLRSSMMDNKYPVPMANGMPTVFSNVMDCLWKFQFQIWRYLVKMENTVWQFHTSKFETILSYWRRNIRIYSLGGRMMVVICANLSGLNTNMNILSTVFLSGSQTQRIGGLFYRFVCMGTKVEPWKNPLYFCYPGKVFLVYLHTYEGLLKIEGVWQKIPNYNLIVRRG